MLSLHDQVLPEEDLLGQKEQKYEKVEFKNKPGKMRVSFESIIFM